MNEWPDGELGERVRGRGKYSPQTGELIDAALRLKDPVLWESWRDSHPDAVACDILDVADDEGLPFAVYADLDDGPRVEPKGKAALPAERSMRRIGASV